jgi:hypothetical protein
MKKTFDLQLIAAQTIMHNDNKLSTMLYNWANSRAIDLPANGHILSRPEYYRAILSDILNDKFDLLKPLIN